MKENNEYIQLLKYYRENHLSHAFLVETNDPDKCYQNILKFIKNINCPNSYEDDCKKCNLCHLTELNHMPSIVTIEPEGINIRKEQIINLKLNFQTKPVYTRYNSYIILNAEALNASSANTMLKFLEEPEPYIIGFFITNSKENVIDTIRSRCEIITSIYAHDSDQIPSIWHDIAFKYLKTIDEEQDGALLYNKDVIVPLIHDRKELMYLLKSILMIYESEYQNFVIAKDISNMTKMKYDIKQMNLLEKLIDQANFNVNINLLLDRFVLESR